MTDDNVVVTVNLPAHLARKMMKPWYLVKKDEADQVRAAMRHAVGWLDEPRSALQESPSPDQAGSPE